MTAKMLLTAMIAVSFCLPVFAQEPVVPSNAVPPKVLRRAPASMKKAGWKLMFADEFNGTKLNTARWIDTYPGGDRTHYNANNEKQYYATDGWRVGRGNMRFIAERRTIQNKEFTSGMVSSFGKFSQKFGWFEMRAQIPKGQGMWPAFWLLPADGGWPPEIDVMETLGHQPTTVYMTNHYKKVDGKHEGKGDKFVGPDYTAGFHTYAVDWQPNEIVWYVDGVERYRTKDNVPSVPMYILANLAVGGDWPGNPDATTTFPSYMDIDYIRVYQK